MSKSQSTDDGDSAFPFEKGDEVLVRARENGTTGTIVVKFTAECTGIKAAEDDVLPSAKARFDLPFGVMNTVTIRPYEAEFEVVE